MGPEVLSKKFNFKYLKRKLIDKEKNIKNILLDQKFVSGIGNIYSNEILFYCKIHPNRLGSKITNIQSCRAACNELNKAIGVLRKNKTC